MTTQNQQPDRLPPHSADAEQAVLGAIMIDKDAISNVLEILKTGRRFYSPVHKKVFNACIMLYEADQAIDITTVAEKLERLQQLDDCGGRSYMAELAGGVATAANVEYYAKIVLEKSYLRDVIHESTDLIDASYRQEKEPLEIIASGQRAFFEIAQTSEREDFVHIGELMVPTVEHIQKMVDAGGGLVGLPSGFKDVDDYIGGFEPGDYVVIAGRPSMGKSAYSTNIAENITRITGRGVAIFSIEMGKQQLAHRVLCGEARVDSRLARTGRLTAQSDYDRLAKASSTVSGLDIFISDTGDLTPTRVRTLLRRLTAQHDIGAVIIDYIQLMQPDHRTGKRVEEITEISARLKLIFKEFGIPGFVVSQLSRQVEQRGGEKRPQLSDLRESGAIEQDADIVQFVYRQDYYLQHLKIDDPQRQPFYGKAEIIIAKQRNGPTGTVEMVFENKFARFQNKVKDPELNAAGREMESRYETQDLPF